MARFLMIFMHLGDRLAPTGLPKINWVFSSHWFVIFTYRHCYCIQKSASSTFLLWQCETALCAVPHSAGCSWPTCESNIPSWKSHVRITESNSHLYTGYPKIRPYDWELCPDTSWTPWSSMLWPFPLDTGDSGCALVNPTCITKWLSSWVSPANSCAPPQQARNNRLCTAAGMTAGLARETGHR